MATQNTSLRGKDAGRNEAVQTETSLRGDGESERRADPKQTAESKRNAKSKSPRIPTLRFKEFEGEWEKHTLKYLLNALVDCEHKTAPYVEDSEYLVVRTNNVKNGQLVYDDIKYTTDAGFKEWTKRSVPEFGDILFTREAPAGESCLVPDNKKVCLGQRMVLLKPNEDKMTGQYLSSYLQSNSAIRNISNLSIGTTVTRINIADIYKLRCPVTSIPEQQKIASFLSAVDKKIQQLTKKKELLEDYKKGVMQQLFSQKIRFKPSQSGVEGDGNGNEFPDWEEKRLGEIGKTFNGLTGKTKVDFGEGKPYIQYMQIFRGSKINPDEFGFVRLSADEKQSKAQYGDAFFTTSSETPNEIGTASVLLDHLEEVYLNSFSFGYRPNNLETLAPQFLQFLLRSEIFRRKIIPLAQGSTRYNMSKIELMKITVVLPCAEEQQKIAKYLSALDTKIEAVNQQIEKTQGFKKGLLQKMFV